jgi:hypothetical protein
MLFFQKKKKNIFLYLPFEIIFKLLVDSEIEDEFEVEIEEVAFEQIS